LGDNVELYNVSYGRGLKWEQTWSAKLGTNVES
jgi:hypothetical protein